MPLRFRSDKDAKDLIAGQGTGGDELAVALHHNDMISLMSCQYTLCRVKFFEESNGALGYTPV